MKKRSQRYCVIDVETPNRHNDRVSSIAVLLLQDGQELSFEHYLVNPEVPFDPFNIALTGIGPDTVEDQPTFPQVWEHIAPYFTDSIVVAHNARFDLSVLDKTMEAYNITPQDIQYSCTLKMSRKGLPDLPNHKLNTICAFLHIPLDHHQAESDCAACGQIFLYLISQCGCTGKRYITPWKLGEGAAPKEPCRSRKTISDENRALQDLRLVVTSLLADHELTPGEVLFLNHWMLENQKLKGNYPFDRIFQLLSEALEDGVLTQDELDYLRENMEVILDPVKWCGCQTDSIDITGKNICLTGDFDRASRSEVEAELAAQGACMQKSVTRKTDYVVVGGKGSTLWAAGNYGTKVKKALELQEKGLPVQIVREEEFFKRLEGVAVE